MHLRMQVLGRIRCKPHAFWRMSTSCGRGRPLRLPSRGTLEQVCEGKPEGTLAAAAPDKARGAE
jgi:hypothetical protein